MIGDNNDETDIEEFEEDSLDDELDEDAMPDIGGETLIDVSGELEALVAKPGKDDTDEAAHRREVRRRLDEIAERRKDELDDTFNFNLDDDL